MELTCQEEGHADSRFRSGIAVDVGTVAGEAQTFALMQRPFPSAFFQGKDSGLQGEIFSCVVAVGIAFIYAARSKLCCGFTEKQCEKKIK